MSAGSANVLAAVFLLSLLFIPARIEAIWLNMPASGSKCVSEEIHNNVVVLADYMVIADDQIHPTPTISAKVDTDWLCFNSTLITQNLGTDYMVSVILLCRSHLHMETLFMKRKT